MNWAAFFGIIGVAAWVSIVVSMFVAAFSLFDKPASVRTAWFVGAVLFVAITVGIGSHYVAQHDRQRQCQQTGRC